MKEEEIEKLKYYLMEFRDKTIELIGILENEDYSKLEEVLNLREKIILEINLIHYNTEVFKMVCNNLKMIQLQQTLQLLMNKKKCKIQEELNRIADKTNANKNYNKAFSADSLYLSKKV